MGSVMLDTLQLYRDEIKTANERMNLVSFASDEELEIRYFADSLACLRFVPPGPVRCIDVGSGAGLPGIPVKIKRPEIDMTLLESVRKKADFLKDVIGKLGLEGIEVVRERAEVLGHDPAHRERYDAAISRATARFAVTLEYTLPLVKVGGCAVIFQGASVPDMDGLANAFDLLGGKVADVEPYRLEEGGKERTLVRVEKTAPTPANYPRRPGVPRKRPLK